LCCAGRWPWWVRFCPYRQGCLAPVGTVDHDSLHDPAVRRPSQLL
jgi:hypothetical protein